MLTNITGGTKGQYSYLHYPFLSITLIEHYLINVKNRHKHEHTNVKYRIAQGILCNMGIHLKERVPYKQFKQLC
jgi:hypothetical protein